MKFLLKKYAPVFIVAVIGAIIGGGLVGAAGGPRRQRLKKIASRGWRY